MYDVGDERVGCTIPVKSVCSPPLDNLETKHSRLRQLLYTDQSPVYRTGRLFSDFARVTSWRRKRVQLAANDLFSLDPLSKSSNLLQKSRGLFSNIAKRHDTVVVPVRVL